MGSALRRRRAAACSVALVTPFALAACLPGSGDPERTSGSSSSSSSSSSTTTETFDEPQQRELTTAEAKAALPTRADMPDPTWKVDGSTFSDSPVTYEPDECAAVELNTRDARTFEEKNRRVDAAARFSRSDADGDGIIAVFVESYAQPYPLAYFDEAGEELADCGEFSRTQSKFTSESTATGISLPLLGERSYGVRIGSHTFDHRTDRLYVRSGHNVITVMRQSSKDDPYDERLLEKYARAVLADLEKKS